VEMRERGGLEKQEMLWEMKKVTRACVLIPKYIYVLILAAAGNKSATRPPLPPPACGGE